MDKRLEVRYQTWSEWGDSPMGAGAGHVEGRVPMRSGVDGQRVRAVSQQEFDARQMPASMTKKFFGQHNTVGSKIKNTSNLRH